MKFPIITPSIEYTIISGTTSAVFDATAIVVSRIPAYFWPDTSFHAISPVQATVKIQIAHRTPWPQLFADTQGRVTSQTAQTASIERSLHNNAAVSRPAECLANASERRIADCESQRDNRQQRSTEKERVRRTHPFGQDAKRNRAKRHCAEKSSCQCSSCVRASAARREFAT